MQNQEFTAAKKQADRKAIKFIVILFILYILFSQGNLFMFSVMTPTGRFYNTYIAEHFDYIQGLKTALIKPAVWIIKLFGFYAIHNEMDVLVINGPYLRINYSCLGLGVMSFLAAFSIAYPKPVKEKWIFFIAGIIVVQLLNVVRFVLLALYWDMRTTKIIDHHTIFNVVIYIIILVSIYFWTKRDFATTKKA